MTGIPKFGKNWLDNFIPDEDLQNTFLTSEVVRNVIMLQCVYLTSVYGEILRAYKSGAHKDTEALQTPIGGPTAPHSHRSNKVTINIEDQKNTTGTNSPVFKVGIIGCGQVGTMILTKLLEIQG